jgi:hypothetical protein
MDAVWGINSGGALRIVSHSCNEFSSFPCFSDGNVSSPTGSPNFHFWCTTLKVPVNSSSTGRSKHADRWFGPMITDMHVPSHEAKG